MKAVLIAAAAAFVLSAAAGTSVGVKRSKKAQAVADSIALADSSTHSDSTAQDSTAQDTSAAVDAQAVALEAPKPAQTSPNAPAVDDTATKAAPLPIVPPLRPVTAAAGAPRGVTAGSAPTATRAAGAASPPGNSSPVEDSVGRLPKLFTAMSARDAAKVLEQMSDHDVVLIIRGMTDRRAGEILAALPPARSAVIARAMLAQRNGGAR